MEYLAAGYMTRFQCLGGACEDTCCKAWDVPVSDADLARLTGALGGDAMQLVSRIPNGKGGTVVVLRKLPDRSCPELEAGGLCKVHARFGEAALPDTCASYPRLIGQLDDRLELTGRMSCPEVARLSLLADDGDLVPSPREPFGREIGRLRMASETPYFAAFPAVRAALVELCAGAEFPFQSRLYFLAELAQRLAPVYARDGVDPARVTEILADVRRPEVQAEMHARRLAASPMDGLALQLVLGMLRTRADATPAFAAVVRKAAGTFAPAGTLEALIATGPEHIWTTHFARRPKPGTPHALRLDRYLARAARHYWIQDWYPVSETLFEHLMHLVLRNALVRFLLLAHPGFGAELDDASCDRAAVEVIYAASRAYDHNPDVRAGLSYMLQQRGMLTVEHCAAMLKL